MILNNNNLTLVFNIHIDNIEYNSYFVSFLRENYENKEEYNNNII